MSDLRLPMAQHITTRDGALDKDSLLSNMFREESEGKAEAVKRPGYELKYAAPVSNTGQGVFTLGSVTYFIVNNTIYDFFGHSFAIGGALSTSRFFDVITDFAYGSTTVAVLKNSDSLWTFDGAVTTQVADVDYPAFTVPGLVLLDGTFYVLTGNGLLLGSALQDPMNWNPLNFVGLDKTLGASRRIVRHLNYVFAFCDQGLQAYYDNANPPPGTPLSPAGNATYLIGCASGTSVVPLDDLTIFMSKAKQRGRSISALQGLSLVQLSTPPIDRILNRSNLSQVMAFGLRVDGHSFYVLSLVDINVTLVCDLISKDWAVWTSTDGGGVESYFHFIAYINSPVSADSQDLIQHATTGAMYSMSPTLYADAGLPITCFVRTTPYDGQTSVNKFFTELNLIGSQVATTVEISYSNDDYQTWSAWRTVDMSSERKMLRSLGRARRRPFRLRHTGSTALRLEAIDFELYLGNS